MSRIPGSASSVGAGSLLVAEGGPALVETVSGDDYAYVDEIEAGAHRRERIAVAC